MTFKDELKALIKKHLPAEIEISGKVTYAQTWNTPEEREEIYIPQDEWIEKFFEWIDEPILDIENAVDFYFDDDEEFYKEVEQEWRSKNED